MSIGLRQPYQLSKKHKSDSKPILITDCAKVIRALGGSVWLLLKRDYGFVIRCEFGAKQAIIIVPALYDLPNSFLESTGSTYVVHNIDGLRSFLQQIKANRLK